MSSQSVAVPRLSVGQTVRLYRNEAKYEFLKTLRMPAYVIPTLCFPLAFYVMFGLIFNRGQHLDSITVSTYMMATYGAFGVIGAAMFGFAVGISQERGFGWLQVKQASPMPPLAYLTAKTLMSMAFSGIVVVAMLALGIAFGGVHLAPLQAIEVIIVLILGAIPFGALGLAIGCWCAPNAAPAVVNLVFLPLSFCSGLWIPAELLPKVLQKAAVFMPPYHLGKLALRSAGASSTGSALQHTLALAAFTITFLWLARRGFARQDAKMYG
jgi:ABC-2 type transport system permease protein